MRPAQQMSSPRPTRTWLSISVIALALLATPLAAKQTKLGTAFTPRHWPTSTWADFQDAATKSAQVGGHAGVITAWVDQMPLSSAQAIKGLLDAKGLQLHLTLDPLGFPDRTQPRIPVGLGTSFTESSVRDAYIARVLELASLRPAMLGLGAEVNLLQSNAIEYTAFVSLTQEAYLSVKQAYPSQRMMISFQWDVMIWGTAPDRFQPFVDFQPSLDVVALTSYPPVPYWNLIDLLPTYYAAVRQLLPTQALGISEIGYPSASPSNETQQAGFVKRLSAGLVGVNAEFVTLALLHDVSIPSVPGLGSVGVRRQSGNVKPSWNEALKVVVP